MAGAAAGPAVGPDGQALAGAPLPDDQASTSRKDPAACVQARDAAARKWARVLERMPADPAFADLRAVAEQVVAVAVAGGGDLGALAGRAAALGEPLYDRWPELRRAIQEAVRLALSRSALRLSARRVSRAPSRCLGLPSLPAHREGNAKRRPRAEADVARVAPTPTR